MQQMHGLYMFDWDVTAVMSDKNAFPIMSAAVKNTIVEFYPTSKDEIAKLDWPQIFKDTRGTTEVKFMQEVFDKLKVPQYLRKRIFLDYVDERKKLTVKYNKENGLDMFDDANILSDYKNLLRNLKETDPECIIGTVTGVPLPVLKVRQPKEIDHLVDFWVGGEAGPSRKDLLALGISHAQMLGWQPYTMSGGAYQNIYYFDDSLRANAEAIKLKINTVWVDRFEFHSPLDLKSLIADELNIEDGEEVAQQLVYGNSFHGKTFVAVKLLKNLEIPSNTIPRLESFLNPEFHQKMSFKENIGIESYITGIESN